MVDAAKAVRQKFKYDPVTGLLTRRRPSPRWGIKAGGVDLSNADRPYIRVYFFGGQKYAHRLIWLWMTGEEPDTIDHINGNTLDNRWCNLRNVSFIENGKNQKLHSNNTSGCSGVNFHPGKQKWVARIMVEGRSIWLGVFSEKKEAVSARKAAEKEHGLIIREAA